MSEKGEQLRFREPLGKRDLEWLQKCSPTIGQEAVATMNRVCQDASTELNTESSLDTITQVTYLRHFFYEQLGVQNNESPLHAAYNSMYKKHFGLLEPSRFIDFCRSMQNEHINPAKILAQTFYPAFMPQYQLVARIRQLEQFRLSPQLVERSARLFSPSDAQFSSTIHYYSQNQCELTRIADENPQAFAIKIPQIRQRFLFLRDLELSPARTINAVPTILTAPDNGILVRIADTEQHGITRRAIRQNPWYLRASHTTINDIKFAFASRNLDALRFINSGALRPYASGAYVAEKLDSFMTDLETLGLSRLQATEVLSHRPAIFRQSSARNTAIAQMLHDNVELTAETETQKDRISQYFLLSPETLAIAGDRDISLHDLTALKQIQKDLAGIARQKEAKQLLVNGTIEQKLGTAAAKFYRLYLQRRENS